ncbi:MAG: hypothetical protein NW226_25895 [Microscillaceae bacterium]|nr:hypothetical protein [Microscillaceae bacterium]
MKLIGLSLLFLCFCMDQLKAQETILGKVYAEDSTLITDVKIQIDQYLPCVSNSEGEFTLIRNDTQLVFRPKKIHIQKPGYLLKTWLYGDKTLTIILEPSLKLEGKVESKDKLPIPEMHIMVVGCRGIRPGVTDAQGKFMMEVPKSLPINQNTVMIAYDSEKYRSKINYEVFISKDNWINFQVEFVPRLVKRVKILDEDNKFMPNQEVFIDGIRYLSNHMGELLPRHFITDLSGFKFENYLITRLEYDFNLSEMRVTVRLPKEGEEIRQVELKALEDRLIRSQANH